MDIGKLPTDNLYKFISISGLLILVVGIGFSYGYLYKVEKLQIEVLNRIHQESIEFGPLTAKEASIERKIEYLELLAKIRYNLNSLHLIDTRLTREILAEIKPLKYEYENLRVDLESIRKDIELNKENLEEKKNGIQLEQGKIMKDSIVYYFLSFAGMGIFIAGLYFWYRKTQSIIDKKLKSESHYDKLFDLKYQALQEINLLYFRAKPKKFFHDMDTQEAYSSVAFSQSLINHWLISYLNKHSAIIDTSDLEKLKELESISNDIGFEVKVEEFYVSEKGIKLSTSLIEILKAVCDHMKNKFDKEYK